jgi:hypothetical protein
MNLFGCTEYYGMGFDFLWKKGKKGKTRIKKSHSGSMRGK